MRGVVDVAEVITAWLALFQIRGEEGCIEQTLRVGKERLLLIWFDSVDGAKRQPKQTIGFILGELGGYSLSEFDGLSGDGGAAYVDGVGVDVSRGGGAVAVGDRPGFAGEFFGGGGGGGVVDCVVGLFGGGEFGGEDPPIIPHHVSYPIDQKGLRDIVLRSEWVSE